MRLRRRDPAPAALAPLFDEAFLAQLQRLRLLGRNLDATGVAGEHRSRRRGSAPEFSEFKPYSPGDDFRRIDWNVYARLDSLFVRLSEVPTELTAHLLLDVSRSMDFGAPRKFDYARRLVGAIAYVGVWHFDRAALVPFSDRLEPGFGPLGGRTGVVPLFQYLERLELGGETDFAAIAERYAATHRRPGLAVVVSDLLTDGLERGLRCLRARRWQVVVVHLLDPAEIDPTIDGERELIDLETGERVRVRPTPAALAAYRGAVQEWMAGCEEACRAAGATYIQVLTSWPIDDLLLRALRSREVVG